MMQHPKTEDRIHGGVPMRQIKAVPDIQVNFFPLLGSEYLVASEIMLSSRSMA